ncbi:MAG: hypothetical protein RLZZ142_1105 [Verrucomicrobiota bacterium]
MSVFPPFIPGRLRGFRSFARRARAGLCALALALGCSNAGAEDSGKYKVLDAFDFVSKNSLKEGGGGSKLKAVETKDPLHPKVIEFTCDFRDAGGGGGFGKSFKEGTINPSKHAAIRFFVRSNTGTSFSFGVSGRTPRKDKKSTSFGGGSWKATEEWKEIIVPIDKLRRGGVGYYDKQKREHVTIWPGGDPPEEEDVLDFSGMGWGVNVNSRGSSVVGHLQFDELSLVLKPEKK